ncbi:DUF262 domain-containing protein [Pedobacter sandarakinus]|uniref:DUF262 domain-containing protein n=1 Tax=Pedobacter sandarakinus TaxID=353156 RepID=UPI0022454061|nr:DUF262 domain-containing protein [Pedobacter sandarakinus]MCX2574075.1 DUF262 domain-containing protein [Pedobacter sandarakinus]
MNIELRIDNDKEILLSPIKKNNEAADANIFELFDENNKSWMELRLINNSFEIIGKDILIIDSDDDLRIKLDKLVLEVIEAEQSGTESTESTLTEEASPYNPDNIKVHSKQFSIKLIDEMIDNGDIDFTPDYQRNFVWNSLQKSRLIESILLRIPLPMFYFSEDEDGKISVVDGLQRLTTIKEFMDNKFPLKNLEYLKDSCEGKYYTAKEKNGELNGKPCIDAKYLRWFNMTQFSVNVIDPNSPPKVKYDIFRRINTGGKPLNNQEIRNSLAGRGLRDTVKEMVSLKEFKVATDYSIKPTRMDDQEVALRFVLFYNLHSEDPTINNYSGYMDSSLDDLTENLSKTRNTDLEKYVRLFSNSMQNAEYLFGSRHAFRKVILHDIKPNAYKQLINKALFVCWSVLLADFDPEIIKSKNPIKGLLEPLATIIENDMKLWGYLSYGTNSKANLLYVFAECKKLINQHLIY